MATHAYYRTKCGRNRLSTILLYDLCLCGRKCGLLGEVFLVEALFARFGPNCSLCRPALWPLLWAFSAQNIRMGERTDKQQKRNDGVYEKILIGGNIGAYYVPQVNNTVKFPQQRHCNVPAVLLCNDRPMNVSSKALHVQHTLPKPGVGALPQ